MATVTQIGPRLGIAPTCAALGLPRATYYRRRRPRRAAAAAAAVASGARRGGTGGRARAACTRRASWTWRPARSTPPCSTRAQYLCSERTMYRVLAAHAEVRERRDQLRHPVYAAPELLARRPNELWSWDITKLLGPGEVDLLLPVRHARRLQPVRGRLDGGPSRERDAGRAVHPRDVCPPGHRRASSSRSTPIAARR